MYGTAGHTHTHTHQTHQTHTTHTPHTHTYTHTHRHTTHTHQTHTHTDSVRTGPARQYINIQTVYTATTQIEFMRIVATK
jgi:hypothetical protein